ncbi:MAG: hypothetical protein RQ856_04905 [Candidatus Izemoplasmatales bacterium]|nr:hypothetical protein [Candidatus Izemoplasmatales bacterium]
MKKLLFTFLILLSLTVIGFTVIRGYYVEESPETQNFNNYYRGGYCHGYYQNELTYEELYLRLSPSEQEEVDLLYTEYLAEYDLTDLTDDEKNIVIEDVKEDLVDYILENYNYYW